jgi:hypothetical protein
MSAGAHGTTGVANTGAISRSSRAAETPMAFRLTAATAVAHGSWNIYILQPEWLRDRGVLVTDRPVRVETMRNGPGMRLTTPGKRPRRWVATPFEVRVEFDRPATDEDVGQPLTDLIKALPETPLRVGGYELTYRGTAQEDMTVVPHAPAGVEPPDEYGASLEVTRGEVVYHLFLSRPVNGDAARLFAICSKPLASAKFPAYQPCETEVRRIAAEYWQVNFQ